MRAPAHERDGVSIYAGDCVEVMREMDAESVDAVVCDPPYGLEFMGKEWDRLDTGGGASSQDLSPAMEGAANGYFKGRGAVKAAGDGQRQQRWHEEWCAEAFRVLKPGGHLLAFGGTRTFHRLACAIEDAGFEIRDCVSWNYGSGFPKSLDVSKAIDKRRHDRAEIYEVTAWIREARDAAGIGNKEIDDAFGANGMGRHWTDVPPHGKQPAVPTLDQVPLLLETLGVAMDAVPERIRRLLLDLNGRKGQPGEAWFQREVVGSTKSTELAVAPGEDRERPAVSLDITAPATDAAREWEGWGTALKPAWEPVVVARKPLIGTVAENVTTHGTGALNIDGCRIGSEPAFTDRPGQKYVGGLLNKAEDSTVTSGGAGRWPANVAFDEDAAAMLDAQAGEKPVGGEGRAKAGAFRFDVAEGGSGGNNSGNHYGDSGGPSRFFYVAKASRAERSAGIEDAKNTHPTVKPVALMRWLVRMVTPPGGTVLDPFGGSGTTGVAAVFEDAPARVILIEREAEYLPIITARIDYAVAEKAAGRDPFPVERKAKAKKAPARKAKKGATAAELGEQLGIKDAA